jgi:alpha-beta hydrolase superfamily lysophospholipase
LTDKAAIICRYSDRNCLFLKKKEMDISIRLSNGQYLRGFINSPGENVKAIVILVHGIGEHSGRYRNWSARFNSKGIGFAALDLPGHGKSDGKRGHIAGYDLVNEMLDTIITQCRKTFPQLPLFLYGHSLGGGMVLQYVLKTKPKLTGVIVTSPFLKLSFEPSKAKLRLASVMKRIFPSFTQPSGLIVEHISHDRSAVDAYRNDPLVHDLISAGVFHDAMAAAAYSLKNASNLSIPMLLVHGSEDLITSPSGSTDFASKANNVTLRIWEGGYHELHNETFADDVFEYIYGWTAARLS